MGAVPQFVVSAARGGSDLTQEDPAVLGLHPAVNDFS
jgi:hypothetical protein